MLDVTVPHCVVLSGVSTGNALLWRGPSSLEDQCPDCSRGLAELGVRVAREMTSISWQPWMSFSKMSMDQGEDNLNHDIGTQSHGNWIIKET